MLIEISTGFASHVGNYSTALPFAVVLVSLLGIVFISHRRQSN